MPKTMKQMKVIFKKYLQERVRVQRAAEAMIVAQQLALAAHDEHQAGLHAQHAQLLLQTHAHVASLGDASTSSTDDEWLIANEYENEEWEEGV